MKRCQTQKSIQLETNLSHNLDQLLNKIQKVKKQHQYYSTSSQLSQTYKSQKSLSSKKQVKKDSTNFYFHRVQKTPMFRKNCSQNLQLFKMQKPKKMHLKSFKSLNFSCPAISLQQFITKSTQEIDLDVYNIGEVCSGQSKKQSIKISDFQLGKCLGSGKFGDVYLCRHKKTQSVYALKKIFKSTIKECNMVSQLAQQLKIHIKLDHPNIVKLYGYFDDQYHIFLLMEYCEDGNLMSKLNITQSQTSQIINQVLEAVSFLHKKKIIHRDIKPQNIMLCHNTIVKLCDFGWSCIITDEMKTTFCGTLDYLSPQMKDRGQYNYSVDLWSIGILTYQLINGSPPLKIQLSNQRAQGYQQNIEQKWKIKYPSYFSALAQSFMKSILKENPQYRLSLRACKDHRFIKNYLQRDVMLLKEQEINIL